MALCCTYAIAAQYGCELGQSCTNVGCEDEARLSVVPEDGAIWADGEYSLTIVTANTRHVCSFELSGPPYNVRMPDGSPACSPELWLDMDPSDSGHWYLMAIIPGTPREAGVVLTRDGVSLVDRTAQFAYEEERPNGPDCPTLCEVGEGRLVLPSTAN